MPATCSYDVSGRTSWQQVARSFAVSCLPFMAKRRRWLAVKVMRFLPVAASSTSYEHTHFFLRVYRFACHAVSDRRRDHRDDELHPWSAAWAEHPESGLSPGFSSLRIYAES